MKNNNENVKLNNCNDEFVKEEYMDKDIKKRLE